MSSHDDYTVYKMPMSAPTRNDAMYRVFLATVLTVDYERKVLTLENTSTGVVYTEVAALPANADSFESTDIQMPEQGTNCLAVPLFYQGGYVQVAIINYMASQTTRAIDNIAMKSLQNVEGYNERKRGNYRKAYPGQKTVTMSQGYTEKIDIGWDRSSQDLSRDKLDTHRRTWTQITGRRVSYTDAGLVFQGAVNRPDATGVTGVILPDGSKEFVVYLTPGAQPTDRYVSGKQDVIPFVENTTRVQEFALDYPLPNEILQTDLLDTVLGTTANPWNRTVVKTLGGVSYDDNAYLINQTWDHPTQGKPLGPTIAEGITPKRRGFMIEKSEGTLVGYNRFDKGTYGKVLKPVYTSMDVAGRFGANFDTGYNGCTESTDHAEARLAASAYSVRFAYEYNTTRWDITKEGLVQFEIGATLPKENIKLQGGYEHPHGAGRSMEGHLVGSLKLVVGKNRDEEDAIDLQALGQTVLRLGADDRSLPDRGRVVHTQSRAQGDASTPRSLQYWTSPKLKAATGSDSYTLDAGSKTVGEGISLRLATDGALVGRLGARDPLVKRRHLMNGYSDGQGTQKVDVNSTTRQDSHSPGRPAYPAGDTNYVFNKRDFTQVGSPQIKPNPMIPYQQWMGDPLAGKGMDAHGLSLDLHLVSDALLRIGQNPASGQSLILDLAGGVVLAAGVDKQGRSLTAQLDGGVEMTIGSNKSSRGLRIEVNGDVDFMVKGNRHDHVTGVYTLECSDFRQISKVNHIVTAQNVRTMALGSIYNESPDNSSHSGGYGNGGGSVL